MSFEIFRFSVLRSAERVAAPEPISIPAADLLAETGLLAMNPDARAGALEEATVTRSQDSHYRLCA